MYLNITPHTKMRMNTQSVALSSPECRPSTSLSTVLRKQKQYTIEKGYLHSLYYINTGLLQDSSC